MSLFVPCVFRTPQFNLGIFHQSDIDLTDHLTATLGLRYDYTHAKIDYDTRGNSVMDFDIMGQAAKIGATSIFAHTEKANFNQLLPKFGLTYKFNDGSNIYATVTKGYRAGGFNVQMFGDIIQSDVQSGLQGVMQSAMQSRQDIMIVERVPTEEVYASLLDGIKFKPEVSWNYEVGTHLNLFDNLMHADLSAFYMHISDQQLSVFTEDYGYGRKMVNAGKSYSCGVEMTLRGSAVDNRLSWSLGYGYTHAAFKDYTTKASARGEVIDYKDKKVPFVPAHTLSAMADYRFDFDNSVLQSLTFGLNMNAQGKIWWDEANTYSQKFYALLGAHVCADLKVCKINLWAKNLTDTKYNTFAFSSKATGKEVFMAQRGNPFQLGVNVEIHL